MSRTPSPSSSSSSSSPPPPPSLSPTTTSPSPTHTRTHTLTHTISLREEEAAAAASGTTATAASSTVKQTARNQGDDRGLLFLLHSVLLSVNLPPFPSSPLLLLLRRSCQLGAALGNGQTPLKWSRCPPHQHSRDSDADSRSGGVSARPVAGTANLHFPPLSVSLVSPASPAADPPPRRHVFYPSPPRRASRQLARLHPPLWPQSTAVKAPFRHIVDANSSGRAGRSGCEAGIRPPADVWKQFVKAAGSPGLCGLRAELAQLVGVVSPHRAANRVSCTSAFQAVTVTRGSEGEGCRFTNQRRFFCKANQTLMPRQSQRDSQEEASVRRGNEQMEGGRRANRKWRPDGFLMLCWQQSGFHFPVPNTANRRSRESPLWFVFRPRPQSHVELTTWNSCDEHTFPALHGLRSWSVLGERGRWYAVFVLSTLGVALFGHGD
ncbi:unnamed protein product [Pleuronectes platessa]|uniref:Uncharacterized protein n=1 Tax=Pleuronectes platessa TaxID=8262 RepID=A0A9N7U1V6_PLEPL|nr:unnamed protein product [Pleuronectes platessa]